MDFNNLTVKLTGNKNYQSLQTYKQEEIKALIKGYEKYAQDISQNLYDNLEKMREEENKKIKNAQTWGTVLNIASLGSYGLITGLINGIVNGATGLVNIGGQLVNNIGKIIEQDGRFGEGGFWKELGSDLLYTLADPVVSVADTIRRSLSSAKNILTHDDKTFNQELAIIGEESKDFRQDILSLGTSPSYKKEQEISEHRYDWANDFAKSVSESGTWFKKNITPVVAKVLSAGVGEGIEQLGQDKTGQFVSEITESMGRMIPSILMAYFGGSGEIASAVSQTYFFSSIFGSSFDEAIERGASVEEAYTYGYGVAMIETLTEQIGGIKLGKILPQTVGEMVSAFLNEGLEEVASEVASKGLESVINKEPVDNKDFMSRAMSSFLGGAISGSVFSGVGLYLQSKSTVGKAQALNKEVANIYKTEKQDSKAQSRFNEKVDSLLESYNKNSFLDNNLIEEGKRTPEQRIKAKIDFLENSGFSSLLIEYNKDTNKFQLTPRAVKMTTNLKDYIGDSNKKAYSSSLYGVEDKLKVQPTNKEITKEQADVMGLSKKLRVNTVIYDGVKNSENGFFDDSIVYINANSSKSLTTNFFHELTHSLEGTKQYENLRKFIMEISETNNILKDKMQELGLTKENIIKDYWEQIKRLDNINSKMFLVSSEYVAFAISEVILKDKAVIDSITKNKSLANRILNWVKEKISDIKSPKTPLETQFLNELKQARKLYEESLGLGYREGIKISDIGENSRYSIKIDNETVEGKIEQNDDLVALHNLEENQLIKIIKLGGFPMPSIAITKPSKSHENFGDITVVFGKDTIDPTINKKNKVWSGDKWTPTFPQVEIEFDEKKLWVVYSYANKNNSKHYNLVNLHPNNVSKYIQDFGLEEGIEKISFDQVQKWYEDNKKGNMSVQEWLKSELDTAILGEGIVNEEDVFTQSGNRRSFSATHYKYTLENVVKAMLEKTTTPQRWAANLGSVNANFIGDYKTIEEIKKDIGKIVDEESYDANYKKLTDDMSNIIDKIVSLTTNEHTSFYYQLQASDKAGEVLEEIALKPITDENIKKVLDVEKKLKGKYNEQLVEDIKNFFVKLRDKVVRYFESKPERAIRLNEIKNVLIPEKTTNKLISLLEQNNIPFVKYGEEGRTIHIENLKDVRFSLSTGIDNEIEVQLLDKSIKNEYDTYNKATYLREVNTKINDFNNIDYKAIAKTTNGKKKVNLINELIDDYGYIIKKNYNKSELYNHLFNNVLQEIILNIANNFDDAKFKNKAELVDSIEKVVSRTMAYMDNTFNDNGVNKLNPNNPDGFQYTRYMNWAFRDLQLSPGLNKTLDILKSKRLSPLFDLLDSVVKLDLDNKQSIDEFRAGLGNFLEATKVLQVNSIALSSRGEFAHTIPNVIDQNKKHINNIIKLVGEKELVSKDGKINKYKRTTGLLGDFEMFHQLSGTTLDMFTFSNIFGLFMENSTGKVMSSRIFEGQKQQLEVNNKFYDHFEKDGFLKNNRKNIDLLEKDLSTVNNLVDANGKPVLIPNSEIIYLRDIMLREIVRDRMIEYKYRGGEQSKHFIDNGLIQLNGNTDDRMKNKANRREVRIVNVVALFNELDKIINNNQFMKNYNKKILDFFEIMYEYENTRNKDISGLELTNDRDTIKTLTESQKDALKKGLGDVDINNIYVPLRLVESVRGAGGGSFSINNVIDLGIDDGLVIGIQESDAQPVIDSINNIIPQYTRSVANYYGLYRVVNDLNILFNKEIKLKNGQTTDLTLMVNKLNPQIIPYYEKLLRDMSGYGVNSDTTGESFNRFLGKVRRNFFKASLGLNLKVILTQFSSLFTVATMYGDFKGTKKSLMIDMFKNLFVKGSKTKAGYLLQYSDIYKDRARTSIYEVKEATSSDFNKSLTNEITEFLMQGITLTDNMINRALFLSLLDHGYTNEQAKAMVEEAIMRYQSSGLTIGKSELLRTQNELVRIFTKFLGEPMKVISNLQESVKHLQIIARLDTNKDKIKQSFENDLKNMEDELSRLEKKKEALEKKIDDEKDKKIKKVLEDDLKELEKNIGQQEKDIIAQEENNTIVERQINQVISELEETKKELGKRVTALVLSLSWQVVLGVVFNLLRSAGKDKKEDENVWAYLGKKVGWQIGTEVMGYLPFARDIYGLIVNKYDANVVNDFQAFNKLGLAIGNLITDISNGGDFNYAKHIRNLALYTGQALGMPTKQIERLFTTPTNYFLKSENYVYRDITGQFVGNNELKEAIKNGDERLIETIIERKLNAKDISLTSIVDKEIKALAKSSAVVSLNKIPDQFSINGIDYKNNKEQFAETYNNASFVVEKIISQNAYQRLDSKYKAKLIGAIFNYYYNLAKQKVSGVQIYSKERTYTLNQAYAYFKDRIAYYINEQQKESKKKRAE